MDRMMLGQSGLDASAWCLGSMTWGAQSSEAEGHAQLDLALDHGIDFVDTAEMYPTNPVRAGTIGRTEAIIGAWLRKTGRRGAVTVATKVSGEGGVARGGEPIDAQSLRRALDASLRRLGTDRVDLLQLHWANRGAYHFRKIWDYDPTGQDRAAVRDNMAEVARTVAALVTEGKLRAWGLSNETAWGVARWGDAARDAGAPPLAVIQNEYSLLCRSFDGDLAEACHHERVPLLAYSPLAAGLLTGKYRGGAIPEASRRSLSPELGGRVTERVSDAVAAYHALARRHGFDPVAMALAWVRSRPVPTVPILGATTTDQLRTALGALQLRLPDTVLREIDAVHKAHPMPF